MTKRLNITLKDDVLRRADAFARRERYSRSGLIAAALDTFIGATEATFVREAAPEYGAAAAVTATAGRPGPALVRIAPLLQAFFCAREDVSTAWVFGSVARGGAGPLSDIDVAVLPAAGLDRAARVELALSLAGRLQGALGIDRVDVVSLPDAGATLAHRVVTEGVRVFGEGLRAATEAEIRAVTTYWDLEPVRRAKRARLAKRMGEYAEL